MTRIIDIIKCSGRVVKLEEKFQKHFVSGHGEEAVFEERSLGWFIQFSNMRESWGVGKDKPEFEVGDEVIISIEKKNAE